MKILAAMIGAVAFMALGQAANASPFTNGSFEEDSSIGVGAFAELSAGDTSITGWTIGGDGVDWIGTYWAPEDGNRSLDMSRHSAGTISQTFDTVANQQYLVSYWLFANLAGPPTIKTIENYINGSLISTDTYDGSSGWLEFTYSFVADSSGSSTILFKSLAETAYGMALDNVSVSAVPLPAALPLFGAGLAAFGVFARKRRRAAV